MKLIKNKGVFAKEIVQHTPSHANTYSFSSNGRAHAMRGDAGSNPAGSLKIKTHCF